MDMPADIFSKLVPITQFNRGQASRIFDRLHNESELIVLKNNQPAAVILAPDAYSRLVERAENYALLMESYKRLSANEGKPSVSDAEAMSHFGITDADLENEEDVAIF